MILPFWSFIWSHVKILTLCQSLSRKLSYYVKLKEVWYNKNLTMKSLQIFLSCSLKENMYKSGLKTRGHIKNITKIEQKRPLLFTFLVWFFMAFLAQKLMYTVNIWFNFMFRSVFEQDHLLTLFISGVYAKRWPKCVPISI